MRIFILFLCFLCAGCQLTLPKQINTLPDSEPASENPALTKASEDLSAVNVLGAQWQIRDQASNNQPVKLSELLKIAQNLQESGEIEEATRLAEKISRISILAIEQALQNQNNFPVYPVLEYSKSE